MPEFTLNNICQSHDSQPGRRKKQVRGSTGSVGERCGNIMDQLLFSPADSNSIRPNIVVCLLFVVVKIENFLLKLLYLAAFDYVSLKTSAAHKNRF